MPSKSFWIGFLISTVLWIGLLSLITIPEYTIVIECKKDFI
jgi:hypothetical protein